MQTDPTFEKQRALDFWCNRQADWRDYLIKLAGEVDSTMNRVRAAHSHLLKGNDDE